jgi:hypothetical protein
VAGGTTRCGLSVSYRVSDRTKTGGGTIAAFAVDGLMRSHLSPDSVSNRGVTGVSILVAVVDVVVVISAIGVDFGNDGGGGVKDQQRLDACTTTKLQQLPSPSLRFGND